MRERKFRAMMTRKTHGHDKLWVYINGVGHSMWTSKNGHYYGDIKPETIGDFIGLPDSKGTDIYEGDIVRSGKRNFEIVFEAGSFMMCFANGSSRMFINEMVEIVGNVYEHPGLLK